MTRATVLKCITVCLVWTAVALSAEKTGTDEKRSFDPAAIFKKFDRDDSGTLVAEEVPERMWQRLLRGDADKDGKLTLEELKQVLGQRERRNPGRKGSTKNTRPGEVVTPAAKEERIADKLKMGDPAPLFTLPDPAGTKEIALADLLERRRPVVLIFGSYTCPPFRRDSAELERICQTYRDRAEFLLVYIREAHPDSVVATVKDKNEVLEKFEQTESFAQRSEHAKQCVASLKLSIPTVVDRDDNRVNQAYAGWPDRLVIVGADGKIAHISGPGPAGFKPAEVENWLKSQKPAKAATD